MKGKPVGALGVDLRFKPDRNYDSELRCLGLVAAMMAQSIKAEHLVDEERRRLMDENSHLLEELKERYDFSNIIGTAGPIRQVYEQIAQVANTNTTFPIRASPVRKGTIARDPYNSPKISFYQVNCAALPKRSSNLNYSVTKGAYRQFSKKGRFSWQRGTPLR